MNVDIKRFWYDGKAIGEVIGIRLLVVFRLLKPEISLTVVIGFDLTCLTRVAMKMRRVSRTTTRTSKRTRTTTAIAKTTTTTAT